MIRAQEGEELGFAWIAMIPQLLSMLQSNQQQPGAPTTSQTAASIETKPTADMTALIEAAIRAHEARMAPPPAPGYAPGGYPQYAQPQYAPPPGQCAPGYLYATQCAACYDPNTYVSAIDACRSMQLAPQPIAPAAISAQYAPQAAAPAGATTRRARGTRSARRRGIRGLQGLNLSPLAAAVADVGRSSGHWWIMGGAIVTGLAGIAGLYMAHRDSHMYG
jgi:hypothetical protein